MSENAEPTPAQGEVEQQEQSPPEVDWKARSGEWEKRAKENKAKADRLDELEEAQKSAEQKAADRLAEAERRATAQEARANAAEVAAESGIPLDIIAGPTDSTPEGLRAFASLVTTFAEGAAQPRPPKPDPSQGPRGAPASSNPADLFATAIGQIIH